MVQLVQVTGPAHTRILSVGAARGDLDVPNDDLIGPIDSSDEWIRQRTGIIQRRRSSADVLAVDLAVEAGEEAIVKSGLDRSEIDGVIIATISNVAITPSMAALAAHRLGLTPAAAFDVSAACAGYVYGVAQAGALVRSGVCTNVLVIGAEKLSDIVDPTDRSISSSSGKPVQTPQSNSTSSRSSLTASPCGAAQIAAVSRARAIGLATTSSISASARRTERASAWRRPRRVSGVSRRHPWSVPPRFPSLSP